MNVGPALKHNGRTGKVSCFYLSLIREPPRTLIEDEMRMADNSLQKTAKTARKIVLRIDADRALYAPCECF
jgi:hypothetical protein